MIGELLLAPETFPPFRITRLPKKLSPPRKLMQLPALKLNPGALTLEIDAQGALDEVPLFESLPEDAT